MLISELKKQIETGKIIDDGLIEVKEYLPIVEKHLIATKIIDSSIIENKNGLSQIDYFYKRITTDVSLLINYASLEFSDELINDYDYLSENGFIKKIIDKIPKTEVYFIEELVESELDQMIRIGNSLENVVASKLQQIIDKIPDEKAMKKLMKDIPKQINKINPENMEILKGFVNKQGDKGE